MLGGNAPHLFPVWDVWISEFTWGLVISGESEFNWVLMSSSEFWLVLVNFLMISNEIYWGLLISHEFSWFLIASSFWNLQNVRNTSSTFTKGAAASDRPNVVTRMWYKHSNLSSICANFVLHAFLELQIWAKHRLWKMWFDSCAWPNVVKRFKMFTCVAFSLEPYLGESRRW